MGTVNFNDLLRALHSSLIKAQDALCARHEAVIRRMNAVDDERVPSSHPLVFAIPKSSKGRDEYEMLHLPMSYFRKYSRPQISTFSMEFECELKKKKFDASLAYFMSIKTQKKNFLRGKKRHHMMIAFHGTNQPFGEVRIDGEILVEIPRDGVCPATTGVKGSVFRAVLNFLHTFWRPQQFILTGAEAQKTREILEQAALKIGTGKSKT